MAPEITKAIRQFMGRVQLQGTEVPAYLRVMQELDAEDHRVSVEIAKAKAEGIQVVESVPERQ